MAHKEHGLPIDRRSECRFPVGRAQNIFAVVLEGHIGAPEHGRDGIDDVGDELRHGFGRRKLIDMGLVLCGCEIPGRGTPHTNCLFAKKKFVQTRTTEINREE